MKDIIRKLKRLSKVVVGKEVLAKPDVACATERLGTEYGGWDIVAENINVHSTVYSFGVGEDASFDVALMEKYGLTIHAFDPTPKSIEWAKRQGFPDCFVMHEYGIAAFDGNALFHPPENPNHVSHTILHMPSTKANAILVPVKRLSTIMKELGHDYVDIVKMDIEGAEYDVIDDLSKSNIRPQQILVEFHHRFPGVGIKKTKEAIDRLRSMGYGVFSICSSHKEFGFIWKGN